MDMYVNVFALKCMLFICSVNFLPILAGRCMVADTIGTKALEI